MSRRAPFSERAFRDALGVFPTGVAIVCARAPDGLDVGVTVNSFTSVSLEPPLVAVNLANSLNSLESFLTADAFAINVLTSEQRHLARVFGRSSDAKWDGVEFQRGIEGCPLIEPNLSVFECRKFASFEAGDHVILVGQVQGFRTNGSADPLVFFQGDYCRVDGARIARTPPVSAGKRSAK